MTTIEELAEAKARIAELEDHAILATLAKNNDELRARIAELEEQLQECFQRNLKLSNTTTARAEKAEARIGELEAGIGIDWEAAYHRQKARAEKSEAELAERSKFYAETLERRFDLYRKAEAELAEAEAERDAILDHFKSSLDARLNDVLCEMKEGWDDSVVGFNEAWDIMRKAYKDFKARAALAPSPAGREG